MKRALIVLGVIIVLLAAAAGTFYAVIFGNNMPVVDGQELAGGAVRIVKDGFVTIAVLDAGNGKVALVDAGNDKNGDAIRAELQRRGLTHASVAAIFLTHGHPDHTAGAHLFPDATVYAMANEADELGTKTHIDHPLHDGEAVDVGDLHVEAFATPGHTAGSAVYFTKGVLFFGDSAGANKEGVFTQAVKLFSKNPDENVASLKALEKRLKPREAEVKTLAFAHCGPLTGFGPFEAFASH